MDIGALGTFDYNPNPEREREELMQAAEAGRKNAVALEVLGEVMSIQRENILRQLEGGDIDKDTDVIGLVMYLRVLKICENLMRTKIAEGKLAEEELNNDGE